MIALSKSLWFVKLSIGLQNIRKIDIDISSTEYRAIQAVYPQATVQWCLFYVARAWMAKIRVLIKLRNSADNAQVHRSLTTGLKSMMWEKDVGEFNRKLAEIFVNYASYPEFLQYFKTNYLDDSKFIQWGAAFQPMTYMNMETNNFVESWHNQLKSTYLERKRNRRADRLVFILVNDIEPDLVANTLRMQLNIARMGPEERRRRRRELDDEAINEEMIALMIKELEEDENGIKTYKINSFTIEDITYSINVSEEEMKSCSCLDFVWLHIACKHMYLLKRFRRNILMFTTTSNLSTPTILPPSIISSSSEEAIDLVDVQTRTIRNDLDVVTSLQVQLNNYIQNPYTLTETQLQTIINSNEHIVKALNNQKQQATNQNLERQHR